MPWFVDQDRGDLLGGFVGPTPMPSSTSTR
jgi:hypothetical protein